MALVEISKQVPRGDPEAYKLAFSEGVRALSEQQAVIDGFRTRSGLLLSGAAIATSFLGQASLANGTSFVSWLAIGLFVLLGAAVVAILWPRGDWEYAVRPELKSIVTLRSIWTAATSATEANSYGSSGSFAGRRCSSSSKSLRGWSI
jgi:hypothetical protein